MSAIITRVRRVFARVSARVPGHGRRAVRGAALLVGGTLISCSSSDSSVAPGPLLRLEFANVTVRLADDGEGTAEVRNTGEAPLGPVVLSPGPVLNQGSARIPGARLEVSPSELPTLDVGQSARIDLRVAFDGAVVPGEYLASLIARVPGEVEARIDVGFSVAESASAGGVADVVLADVPARIRQGQVLELVAVASDSSGGRLSGVPLSWGIEPAGAGLITAQGRFVPYGAGEVTVTVASGTARDTRVVVIEPRSVQGQTQIVGRGPVTDRFTSDLWVHGNHAYTGTWGIRQQVGNTLHTWDISNPAAPVRTSSLQVDARTTNDVKVSADGRIGIVTHEGSNDGRNGITLLDLRSPDRPTVFARYTTGLESGVHNAWIDGFHAYLVRDGLGAGLQILDISNPRDPLPIGNFYAGESFLHDVYVRDGLAFLSHWNAGLVIVDVGHGLAGGSPSNPVEVSRVPLGGQTHNAWYWPERAIVFVGEEDFGSPGIMHVVDVADLRRPVEVATFAVPGTTPHNFWLDEASELLYMAWYDRGLRALDVRGALLGELDRQGRDVLGEQYLGSGRCFSASGSCGWGPQLHGGVLWVSDPNNGLVGLRPPTL